ncbi:MAG: divalent-cation tolerance protein CutA [Verrucomicrobiota bacterium]
MSEVLIGWTTCDNPDVAERLAHELVERDLAACVQIEDGVRSVFKWKGEIQSDLECRLCVKFDAEKIDTVGSFIKAHHPYDNPEWVVTRADVVSERYQAWVTGR